MLRRRRALPRPLVLPALAATVAVLALTRIGDASPANANVAIADNSFSPTPITVTAGDTVIWTHTGARTHTVTADDGSFDSNNLTNGQTFSRTFATAGTIRYYCKIHGAAGGVAMSATIIVQAAAATTTTAPPTTTTVATTTTVPGADTATAAATTTTTTTTTRPASVEAVTVTRRPARPPALARTGAYTGSLAAIGLALVLMGAVVVGQTRSARQARDDDAGRSS